MVLNVILINIQLYLHFWQFLNIEIIFTTWDFTWNSPALISRNEHQLIWKSKCQHLYRKTYLKVWSVNCFVQASEPRVHTKYTLWDYQQTFNILKFPSSYTYTVFMKEVNYFIIINAFPIQTYHMRSLGVLKVSPWYFDHWIIEHQQKVKLANYTKLICPSAAYMHQWMRSALLQIMSCRLFGAKPLSQPMLGYCQLDP